MFRILIALMAIPAFANSGFNGRWNIQVDTANKRSWWLEIKGAETPNPSGSFVSAYGGDLNKIDEIAIKGDELTFGFRPPKRGRLVYKAKLAGGKLHGTFVEEGSGRPPLNWLGMPAPVINDKDDNSWRRGKPVELFNGKDLSGWSALLPNKPMNWSVTKDGTLANTAGANNIISDKKFWNFELHVEYKVGEHSNSGIGLRGRYEIQILEDYGKPPNTHSNGALYSRVAPSVNASKPAGEWQTYDIRLVGRTVTVVLNGKKILDKVEIEGFTAVAMDPFEDTPGPIFLQGDHGPVEFRKITLTPLTR